MSKAVDRQIQIPGTDAGAPSRRARNGPLSIADVVKRLIDLDGDFARDVDDALARIREKLSGRADAKRAALLARLPNDADRETAERVARAALKALRTMPESALEMQQVALPGAAQASATATKRLRTALDELKSLINDVVLAMRGQAKAKVSAEDLERAINEAYTAYLWASDGAAGAGDDV